MSIDPFMICNVHEYESVTHGKCCSKLMVMPSAHKTSLLYLHATTTKPLQKRK